jgi:hypothetical protein
MLNTLRRDRRNRRPASFTLEALDDRIVLSAAAAGAVAGVQEHRIEVQIARHEAKLDRLEARHEAKLATKEATQVTMISQLQARAASLTPVSINSSGMVTVSGSGSTSTSSTGASASGTTSPSTVIPSPPPTSSGSTNPSNYVPTSPGTTTTTGSGTTSPGTLPANVSAALQSLYQEYESAGGSSFTPSLSSDKLLLISGDSVGVDLQMSSSGNFSTFLSQLQSDGLTVSASSATYGQVDGMVPISDLPAIAQVAASVTPMSPPLY